MWLSMQMLTEFSTFWKPMDSFSAAGLYNFRCIQKTFLSFQWHCQIACKFIVSGFLISLLPQDKQFAELHVGSSSYMIYSHPFLILVIYLQSSLLENTILRTMVTSDTRYDFFYINLKAILFRDEELWCSPEAGGDELVEQVWSNMFLPVTFPLDNWRIISL